MFNPLSTEQFLDFNASVAIFDVISCKERHQATQKIVKQSGKKLVLAQRVKPTIAFHCIGDFMIFVSEKKFMAW